MYLIDSICKNHGSPYKEMFNHNLVSNFAYIFQQVSEKVRSNLYKLRITWGGNFQIFTPAVLHQDQEDRPSLACDPSKASCQRPHGPKWRLQHQDSRQSKLCQQNGNNTVIFYLFFFIILLQQAKAKTPPVVDETEKMREELLRAEAELIQLKKMQVEQQILEAKKSLQQVSNIIIHYFSSWLTGAALSSSVGLVKGVGTMVLPAKLTGANKNDESENRVIICSHVIC